MLTALSRLIYTLRLARPLFLVGGFVFYGLGVMIALYQGAALDDRAAVGTGGSDGGATDDPLQQRLL